MIGKSIQEAFSFALSPKRVAIFFALDLLILFSLSYFFSSLFSVYQITSGVANFLTSLSLFIVVMIFTFFISFWIQGALIDQARYFPKDKPLEESFKYSSSRYLPLLGAAILLGIISFIASIIPFIGFILVVLISLIFFFLQAIIVIDKNGIIDSFKRSYQIFMKRGLTVLGAWLASSLIFFVIILVAGIPLLAMLIGTFLEFIVGSGAPSAQVVPPVTFDIVRSPLFQISLVIFALGLAFASVFMIGVQARLYINLTKKRQV